MVTTSVSGAPRPLSSSSPVLSLHCARPAVWADCSPCSRGAGPASPTRAGMRGDCAGAVRALLPKPPFASRLSGLTNPGRCSQPWSQRAHMWSHGTRSGPSASIGGQSVHGETSAVSWPATFAREVVVPTRVVVESSWLICDRRGSAGETRFLCSVTSGELCRGDLTDTDWERALAFVEGYAGLAPGLVDASIVATAERLDVTRHCHVEPPRLPRRPSPPRRGLRAASLTPLPVPLCAGGRPRSARPPPLQAGGGTWPDERTHKRMGKSSWHSRRPVKANRPSTASPGGGPAGGAGIF